ncbi:MAG: tRNA guanosine(15) transglycosylase TgtA [Nanoarchaeota archaeon]|nr:tRNA guanosine(15) transglycosylase TgtA [Nanoarchaeota archaeon]
MILLELKARDAGGRICKAIINGKELETPAFLPVINPRIDTIPVKELKELGVQALITNAYFLLKNHEDELKKGVHDFLGFDGVVMLDSGAFQLMRYGSVNVTNRKIIEFQKKIKPDIGVILDVPVAKPSREDFEHGVKETLKRAKEWKKLGKGSVNWAGPVHGGPYEDLLKKSAVQMSKLGFDMYCVGSLVPAMEEYDFKRMVDQVITAKKNLPSNVLVHAFGAGHPMVMPLLALLGIDLFDSASYAIFAKENRYITERGTIKLKDLREFPCNCPSCFNKKPEDLKEPGLARHNLYVILAEVRRIKQAIHTGRLWELVLERAMVHPALLEATKHVLENHYEYFLDKDPLTKRKAFFYAGEVSSYRPAIVRASQKFPGQVPSALRIVYPFGQFEGEQVFDFDDELYTELETLRLIGDYWFGKSAGKKLFPKKCWIKYTRTGRIHQVFLNEDLLGVLRTSDGYFALHRAGALRLKTKLKKVVVKKDAESFVLEGRNALARFVKKVGKGVLPGDSVLVTNSRGKFLGVGEALLNSEEMLEFNYGNAVKVREGFEKPV